MGLDFSVVPGFLDNILIGALWTIAITLSSAGISFFGGILFAVISLYGHWVIRLPFRAFAFLFMGTPLLLQLFLIYFGLIQIGIRCRDYRAWLALCSLQCRYYQSRYSGG